MPKHTKPTEAELQAEIDKAIVEAETPETPEEEIVEETEEETPEETEDVEEEESEEPDVPEVDYKKKFVESSRESIVNHARARKFTEAVTQAAGVDAPTEEELMSEYKDWDLMTDTEKLLARDGLINKKRFKIMESVAQEGKNIEDWIAKVDTFIENPATLVSNPELEGKQEEFKLFASKPTRRGLDFGDLILAFIGENAKNVKPKMKTSMMEDGTGGPKETPKPKSDKISLDEAKLLMQTDYKKYKELLKDGKIDVSGLL